MKQIDKVDKHKKFKRSKRKHTRVVDGSVDYAGGRSPYWEFLDQRANRSTGRSIEGSLELHEPVEANPDSLPEEANIFSHELSDGALFKLEVIQEGMERLSEQQRRIVYYCGIKGLSLESVATELRIKKGTAQKLLDRTREKIKKLYVIRQAHIGL